MAQYAILRFAKHKGGASGALEAHHEQQKEDMPAIPILKWKKQNTEDTIWPDEKN